MTESRRLQILAHKMKNVWCKGETITGKVGSAGRKYDEREPA